MKKQINYKTLGIIGGACIFAISAILFYDLWNKTVPEIDYTARVGAQYQVVNIENEKQEAEELVAGKENNVPMPISPLSGDKVGKENPFSSL
ncbi:MAG: hypothetical protein WC107_02545 [Patescibacteria group bacterium]